MTIAWYRADALKGATLADLLGRRVERDVVLDLLSQARAGRSGALVVRGEAGIGKTALLEEARGAADSSGFRVESAVGVESETQLAFAGLHQLCASMLARTAALPEPQQAALDVAFGRRHGAAPDLFLVGLAALSLLAEVAEERPLLCVVDDAQWLDQASEQVLAFVARRIGAEKIALLLAVRDQPGRAAPAFAGLSELHLGGLNDGDARTLLADAVHTPVDGHVRDRIVSEARGNPLALVELPRGLRPGAGVGEFDLLDADVPRRIEDSFRRRSSSLPVDAQLLLLVAAADPTGDAPLLWRAVTHLGIPREAAEPAEIAGLLQIDTHVRFRHPLVRSAVYRAASAPDRRRAHDALAAVTDPRIDQDRWAWHRAQAVLGTDEDAAANLERSADRARARGGVAAAASFLQLAAELTPDRDRRTRRALDAASAKFEAGAPADALALLDVAAAGPLDALHRARLDLLRAQIAFQLRRGTDVPAMMLRAAEALAPLDASLSRDTYLEAFDAALSNGGHAAFGVADAARAAPPAPAPARPCDLLLDGLVASFTEGHAAGVPTLQRALEAFRDENVANREPADRGDRWLWLAFRNAVGILDDELAFVLASRHVQLARETGALATLPAALVSLADVFTLSGELVHASELAAESVAISEATGAVPLRHTHVMLAAWRGDRAAATELNDLLLGDATNSSGGGEVAVSHYAMAVLHNGLGDYALAEKAARRARETDELGLNVALPELIEAAMRSGHARVAEQVLDEFSQLALACAAPWAVGLEARSRALTSDGPAAEDHYRDAIDRLSRSRMAGEAARAHLVFGEWLRREGRRKDARMQLRDAHEMFSHMGAEAFAERAARELRATGEHPRGRTTQPTDALTAHELQVARLAASGETSREIGAQLFLSPRTIEAHLRSIFRKLGISSRRQLRQLSLP